MDTETQVAQTQYAHIVHTPGKPLGVIVPIELRQEIESERETAYLLKSDAMKRRLSEAKNRQQGISSQ